MLRAWSAALRANHLPTAEPHEISRVPACHTLKMMNAEMHYWTVEPISWLLGPWHMPLPFRRLCGRLLILPVTSPSTIIMWNKSDQRINATLV
jgi:hypothetical protein